MVTIHNFRGEAIEIELKVGNDAGRSLTNLLSDASSEADARGRHHIVLEPYGYRWYRAGGLGYLLERAAA
ncbi:MAG: hypothetical protein ACYC0T_09355 [Ramlibacter sp.]